MRPQRFLTTVIKFFVMLAHAQLALPSNSKHNLLASRATGAGRRNHLARGKTIWCLVFIISTY